MNEVKLDGKLVRDIDLKFVKNGQLALLKNCLAVNKDFGDGVDYINIVAWKDVAEEIANTCQKGSQIEIEGRIQTGSYAKQDGTKVYTTDIVVNKVIVANPLQPLGISQGQESFDSFEDDMIPVDDGDIPF